MTLTTSIDWAHITGNLKFHRLHDSGGHFASWERPAEFIADLREVYGPGGGAFGVVSMQDKGKVKRGE